MLVDMHLHECTHSADSHISLAEIVSLAKARGLDAVCITDHDNMNLQDYAAEYSKAADFPIFVGIEFYSLQGDITAWGMTEYPGHRIDAQPFIDLVNAAGGFCAACHPFRNNRRGLEEYLSRVTGLHGVEVLNGSTDMDANRTALRYCRELGLQAIGASDAHTAEQVGKYVTWLPELVTTTAEFVQLLHSRPTRPAIWTGSGYDVVDTF